MPPTPLPPTPQVASATLDGQIYLWDPQEGDLLACIEGRRDIKGGRLLGDRRAAGNLASGACFNSLAYSADGSFLVAGGAGAEAEPGAGAATRSWGGGGAGGSLPCPLIDPGCPAGPTRSPHGR